jgi:hypothetical protein
MIENHMVLPDYSEFRRAKPEPHRCPWCHQIVSLDEEGVSLSESEIWCNDCLGESWCEGLNLLPRDEGDN